MQIIAYLLDLVTFVLALIVLIKLFQKEGVLKGILGLICMLYTFIWGWIKARELNITNIMIGWTVAIILLLIVNFVVAGQMMATQIAQ
jgi:hypothetical protein